MLFTFSKNFGALELRAFNEQKEGQPQNKTTRVRVWWDREFQEDIFVATASPKEAVEIAAEQLMLTTPSL